MDKEKLLTASLIAVLILTILVNFFALPYLLMIVLNAFSVKVGYWVCFGLWFLISVLVSRIKA